MEVMTMNNKAQFKSKGRNRANVSNRKGNNKSKRSVDSTRYDEYVDDKRGESKSNPIDWYNKNPMLLQNTSSISYGNIQGYPIHQDFRTNTGGSPSISTTVTSPGICVLRYLDGPGIAGNYTDAVNVAARNLFGKVRKMNSGYSNYDPNDLMMYILAMTEVYKMHSEIMRMYGVLQLYRTSSKYYPTGLCSALNYDFDDMIQHMPQVRTLLNTFAARTNIFAVPSDMAYMVKQYWMPSGLYTDSANRKAQVYALQPMVYRTFEVQEDGNSTLVAHSYIGAKSDKVVRYSDLVSITNAIVSAITENEDFAIMSGDIRKAYGDNVWTLNAVADDYTVQPLHDYTVLAMIENASIVGAFYNGEVTQANIYTTNELNASRVNYSPHFAPVTGTDTLDPRTWQNYLLNAHTDDTTVEFTTEATRFVASLHPMQGQMVPTVCGTELIMGVRFYSNDEITHVGSFLDGTATDPGILYQDTAAVHLLRVMYSFDWNPRVYLINTAGTEIAALIDIDNYAVVNYNTIDAIHYACILSLFNIQDTK
nr:capsid protein [Picobirnavirus sp.]AVD97014.1 capsid protein [Picobirnavirus sp.]